jgi:phosphoribosylaminoimidazole (AIR) synthetase
LTKQGSCSVDGSRSPSTRQPVGTTEFAETGHTLDGGIGFVVIASPQFAESIQRQLQEDRVPAFVIGEVREGEAGVKFRG